MQCTTIWAEKQLGCWLGSRLRALAIGSLILAALLGRPVESSRGWVTCPPPVPGLAGAAGQREPIREGVRLRVNVRAGWEHGRQTWVRALARSEFLVVMGLVSSRWLPDGVLVLPWVEWLVEGVSGACPWLGRQPEMGLVRWGLGWLRWGSLLLLSREVVGQGLRHWVSLDGGAGGVEGLGLLIGCVVQRKGEARSQEGKSQPQIEARPVEGGCRIRLKGEFYLTVKDKDPFRQRLAMPFLRPLEGPSERWGSRATRDGRRPLVRQQQLAAWFGVPQPDISRWEGYWLGGDWANLLSLQSAEVLTIELRDQIVEVMARLPWWRQERVYEHLRAQGVAVTYSQVRQAAHDSGWAKLGATLKRFFVISPGCIRPRDEGLERELLAQVQTLLSKLETGEGLTPLEQLDMAHLQTMCAEVGLTPPPPPPAVPWAQKVKWVLFAAEAMADDGVIRCTCCGSTNVRPKGRKPHLKRYLDEQNQWQTVEVYRYRCDNPECPYGSFTPFPLGLRPYSPYRLEMRIAALEMYAWGRSSYRRTAQALGVRAGRAYLWVSAFGQELLPVAALFGVVRCSGVVGMDEKWVQVPEKAPRGSRRSKKSKPRRWMYVYFAVDVYTYDLLHIAIYAHHTADSTRFLVGLARQGVQAPGDCHRPAAGLWPGHPEGLPSRSTP